MARVRILPLHRFRCFVVMPDIAHELSFQIVPGGEDAARDNVTFDLCEPELHLIEPGRVGRREMQPDGRMACSRTPRPSLSCARRDCRGSHGFPGSAADGPRAASGNRRTRRRYGARRCLPCTSPVRVLNAAYSESVPWRVILKAMAFGAAGRHGQHRIQAIQRLDRRLFIHTEDGGVLRRVYSTGR